MPLRHDVKKPFCIFALKSFRNQLLTHTNVPRRKPSSTFSIPAGQTARSSVGGVNAEFVISTGGVMTHTHLCAKVLIEGKVQRHWQVRVSDPLVCQRYAPTRLKQFLDNLQ
ncbi:unnamed protein product [Ceratitis capitata]|uniref:(Mediterranean fruit fly) hypothetical protein n=1 Tax=Ceratitis capitata TaxID=7213 RepID=A0A811TYV3_CERCA|nr:unnamed protein product [Ceratitis capitata]